MTGNLSKTSLILMTVLLTLFFATGCSCSTVSNQNPSMENPVSEESGTENGRDETLMQKSLQVKEKKNPQITC